MKKYVLTDDAGNTPDHVHLEPGKVVHSASRKSNDPMIKAITSGYDSPVLAMMETEDPASVQHRLFVLNTWSVKGDGTDPKAYTIVKEVPLPSINLQHKVAFAVSAIAEIFGNEDFTKWADGWVSGSDRSVESAKKIHKELADEAEAAEGLADLAAWGVSGDGDADMLEQQGDAQQRAMHVVAAAELAAGNNPVEDEVHSALHMALHDIGKYNKKVDLAKLAEKVIGFKEPE